MIEREQHLRAVPPRSTLCCQQPSRCHNQAVAGAATCLSRSAVCHDGGDLQAPVFGDHDCNSAGRVAEVLQVQASLHVRVQVSALSTQAVD